MTADPIIVSQSYAASMDAVWTAITDPSEMRQWFFEAIETFEPTVGFETRFNVTTPNRDFLHCWKITDVDPGRKIAYSWTYEDIPGDGLVTFELSEHGDQTQLQLTCEGVETFPQDMPEFTREAGIAGWNYFIRERLKEYLERA